MQYSRTLSPEQIRQHLRGVFAYHNPIIDRDLTAAPGAPAAGDRYLVAAGATGTWAGHDGKVAEWDAAASAWTYDTPQEGWRLFVKDENVELLYDGAAWQDFSQYLSAAILLAKLLTVDGAGSGLDADTTDGKHASATPTADTIVVADGTGKIATGWLPSSITGALNYKGTWDAAANSPALASGVGSKGDYYRVSVAGNTTLDGNTAWKVDDVAIFNGTDWDKIDGAQEEMTGATAGAAGTAGAVPAPAAGDQDKPFMGGKRYGGACKIDTLNIADRFRIIATGEQTLTDGGTNQNITGATFATADYQGAFLFYTIQRGSVQARAGVVPMAFLNAAASLTPADYAADAAGSTGITFDCPVSAGVAQLRATLSSIGQTGKLCWALAVMKDVP